MAISITKQPTSVVINTSETTTLSVVATTSAGTLAYQWYQGAVGVITTPVGTNSANFTTPALTTTTTYWVKVTASTFTANSTLATVTVVALPTITFDGGTPVINTGDSAAPYVTATTPTGGTLAYQWYVGNVGDRSVPATGATATTNRYTTPALTATTTYWPRVTNTTSGNIGTNGALTTVIVIALPTINTQPTVNTYINSGMTATLSVDASTDIRGIIGYQWYKGAVGVTTYPVTGATTASFTTTALTATTTYWVLVTNITGSTVGTKSTLATVTVIALPTVTSLANTTINIGSTATLTVAATTPTGGTLGYQWYTGTLAAGTPITGAKSQSYTTPTLASTTTYWVLVTNITSSITGTKSTLATVTVIALPTITAQPTSSTIYIGRAVTLSVTATTPTGGTLAYQWYVGNVGDISSPISGAISKTYTTIPTTTTTYWVKVTNTVIGTTGVQSNAAIITISNVQCSGRQIVIFLNTYLDTEHVYCNERGVESTTFNLTLNSFPIHPTVSTPLTLSGNTTGDIEIWGKQSFAIYDSTKYTIKSVPNGVTEYTEYGVKNYTTYQVPINNTTDSLFSATTNSLALAIVSNLQFSEINFNVQIVSYLVSGTTLTNPIVLNTGTMAFPSLIDAGSVGTTSSFSWAWSCPTVSTQSLATPAFPRSYKIAYLQSVVYHATITNYYSGWTYNFLNIPGLSGSPGHLTMKAQSDSRYNYTCYYGASDKDYQYIALSSSLFPYLATETAAGTHHLMYPTYSRAFISNGYNTPQITCDNNTGYDDLAYLVYGIYQVKSHPSTKYVFSVSNLIPDTFFNSYLARGIAMGVINPPKFIYPYKQPITFTATQTYPYTGSPITPTIVSNEVAGVPYIVTYDGSSTPPTTVGTYPLIIKIANSNVTYIGADLRYNLTITAAPATITITKSTFIIGESITNFYTTTPSNLNVIVRYIGSTTLPTSIGTYSLVLTINDPNYTGTITQTITIKDKTIETVTFVPSTLSQAYDNTTKSVSAITTPVNNIPLLYTYNDSNTGPITPGSYTVIATINSSPYQGSATNTLVISKAIIPSNNITINGYTPKAYDGNSLAVLTATLNSSWYGINTTDYYIQYTGNDISYNTTTPPTNKGNYTATAYFNNTLITGSTTQSIVISPALITCTFNTSTLTQEPQTITNPSITLTNSVNSTVIPILGTDYKFQYLINGTWSNNLPTANGVYTVQVVGINPYNNYQIGTIATPYVTPSATFTVKTKILATVAFVPSTLSLTFDSSTKSVSATTNPANLLLEYRYNGSLILPIIPGSYPITATITDINYAGSASNTLIINKAIIPSTNITLYGNVSKIYDKTAINVITASLSTYWYGNLTTDYYIQYTGNDISYNSTIPPTNKGNYTATAYFNNTSLSGTTSETLSILPATITCTFDSHTTTQYIETLKNPTISLVNGVNSTVIPILGTDYKFQYYDGYTLSNSLPTVIGPYTCYVTLLNNNYIFSTNTTNVSSTFIVTTSNFGYYPLIIDNFPFSDTIDSLGNPRGFKFSVTRTNNYIMQTFGATDTILYLYDSDKITLLATNDDSGTENFPGSQGKNALINKYLLAGKTYYLRVQAYNNVGGNFTISVTTAPTTSTTSTSTTTKTTQTTPTTSTTTSTTPTTTPTTSTSTTTKTTQTTPTTSTTSTTKTTPTTSTTSTTKTTPTTSTTSTTSTTKTTQTTQTTPTTSTTTKAPIIPTPTTLEPVITIAQQLSTTNTLNCNQEIASQNQEISTFIINIGNLLGKINLIYNTYNSASQFILFYNNIDILDTGFVGNSINNNELISLGYSSVVGNNEGIITLNHTDSTTTYVQLQVISPLIDKSWSITVTCPIQTCQTLPPSLGFVPTIPPFSLPTTKTINPNLAITSTPNPINPFFPGINKTTTTATISPTTTIIPTTITPITEKYCDDGCNSLNF